MKKRKPEGWHIPILTKLHLANKREKELAQIISLKITINNTHTHKKKQKKHDKLPFHAKDIPSVKYYCERKKKISDKTAFGQKSAKKGGEKH